MGKGRFIFGTLLGAAAGVVAGVLTAPKSGEETREDLKVKANELKEEAARRTDALRSQSGSAKDAASEEAKHRIDNVVKSVKKDTKDTL